MGVEGVVIVLERGFFIVLDDLWVVGRQGIVKRYGRRHCAHITRGLARLRALTQGGQIRGRQIVEQGAQECGPNVASHGHVFFGFLQHLRAQARDGGLAIGAGDDQHIGLVLNACFQVIERLGKKTQLIARLQALALGRQPQRVHTLGAQTRAFVDTVKTRQTQELLVQARAHKLRLWDFLPQGLQLRGLLPVVRHPHSRPTKHPPAGHGQTGVTKSQDEQVLMGEGEHGRSYLNFRVDRPTKHSSIVMIQKRTTTWVSGQPIFSK